MGDRAARKDLTREMIGIERGRFWSTVMRSGEIGPGKAGGLRRLALTDADKEMRDLFDVLLHAVLARADR